VLKCFQDSADEIRLDRSSFRLEHKLIGHQALTLSNLERVIPALPPNHVMYSKELLDTGADFEGTFRKKPSDRTIEETIASIRVTDSYIMVRSPEVHPSFESLYRDLLDDVQYLMRKQGVGKRAIDPQLYLFIASPNSVTPFHIDRYSTFLLQFQGSKTVSIFPQWNETVVAAESLEDYVSYRNTKLHWSPSMNELGVHYDFKPGQALHIPFAAGHHVKNGPEDVSVSMSIIFNTEESMVWRRALQFNRMARRRLRVAGLVPRPVGRNRWRDVAKSTAWRLMNKIRPST
jgi:hypothetical protein